MASLVIAEHDNASIKGATLNTVTAAVACGGDVHVLVAGHNAGAAAQAAAQIAGVSKVIHADSEGLAHGLAENVAAQVLAIAANYTHILFPATASGALKHSFILILSIRHHPMILLLLACCALAARAPFAPAALPLTLLFFTSPVHAATLSMTATASATSTATSTASPT